jgi:CRP/FNR family transcriptional regulator, cyclic AMP receptor protein
MSSSAKLSQLPDQPGQAAVPEVQERQLQVHLRKIPLLADLTDEEILQVRGELRFRHYPKRSVVLHKGGSGDGLLFVGPSAGGRRHRGRPLGRPAHAVGG